MKTNSSHPIMIDISLPVYPGMFVYPGECETVREFHLSPTDEAPCTCTHWSLTAHAGTHLDAPRHFDPKGRSISDLTLEECRFRCAVIDARRIDGHVDAAWLRERASELDDCDAVIFRTHDGELWKRPFDPKHRAINPEGARWLVAEKKLRLVGIDYFSVEPFGSSPAQTHLEILTRGALILEGVDLSSVEPGRYGLLCFPVLWRDAEAAPCRAILLRET